MALLKKSSIFLFFDDIGKDLENDAMLGCYSQTFFFICLVALTRLFFNAIGNDLEDDALLGCCGQTFFFS